MTDYDALIRAGALRVSLAVVNAPDAPVAACPGWRMHDLGAHMQQIYAALTKAAGGAPAAGLVAGAGAFIDAINALPADSPLLGMTAGLWHRQVAHETTVHAYDAGSGESQIDADAAADGVDHFLTVILPRRARPGSATGTLHLHRTDGDGEWLTTFTSDAVTTTREHAKGDAAIRGPASRLLLWVWGRAELASPLEVFGDSEFVAAVRERMAV